MADAADPEMAEFASVFEKFKAPEEEAAAEKAREKEKELEKEKEEKETTKAAVSLVSRDSKIDALVAFNYMFL